MHVRVASPVEYAPREDVVADADRRAEQTGGSVTLYTDPNEAAAGADSPRKVDFPRYMDDAGENPRGPNAVRVLSARRDFTVDTLLAAGYDSYIPAFADLVPSLLAAYDRIYGKIG